MKNRFYYLLLFLYKLRRYLSRGSQGWKRLFYQWLFELIPWDKKKPVIQAVTHIAYSWQYLQIRLNFIKSHPKEEKSRKLADDANFLTEWESNGIRNKNDWKLLAKFIEWNIGLWVSESIVRPQALGMIVPAKQWKF